jgi:Skp family chaperone for outer membrane proteins
MLMASVMLIGVAALRAQNGAPNGAVGSGSTSVAVIDVGYLFKNYKAFSQAMDDIKRDFEEFEKRVGEQRASMTQKAERLKSLPAGSAEYRQLEEELADATTKQRLEIGRKQKERVEKEAKIYFNAYRRVEWEVQRFADRFGIDLVVRFNSEQMDPAKPETVLQGINRFVVFHRSLNITDHIVGNLNTQVLAEPAENNRPHVPGQPTRQ